MFHIHTRREYIISPSGYCGLSGEKDWLCRIIFAQSLWGFFLRREGKLFRHSPLFPRRGLIPANRCCTSTEQAICARRFAGQIMTYGWVRHALWPSPLISLRPALTTGAESCWGGGLGSPWCCPAGTAMIKQTKNKNVSWVSEVWSRCYFLYSWTS